MYRITREFRFSASHQLERLPPEHPCARLHGHNYRVRVELCAAGTDINNFVRDYRSLAPLKEMIDTRLDHRHLNEVFGHDMVTSEWLARYIHDWCRERWPETCAAMVSETPSSWAEYRPGPPP